MRIKTLSWIGVAAISFAAVWAEVPVVPALAAQESPAFTMALTGDSIITRRLSVFEEPEFLEMIELIRSADVAFTNLEMLFHDYEPFPTHQSGGTYMRGDPALAKELVWAGFDIVSRANNHTGDYGVEGMRLTSQYVEAVGLVHAGVGESLTEAREPKFIDTAQGRVALISVASTFADHMRAGRSRGDIRGRPGLNPLRYSTTNVTTEEGVTALREALTTAGFSRGRGGRGGAASVSVFGTRVVAGDEPGRHTIPNAEDMEEIAAAVRSAARLADYTIVTSHTHESDGNRLVPAEFLVTFARAMVDAGADVFVGHGPHVLRGVEIYQGKPILYSLGDFIFQNETLLRLPSENYEAYDLDRNAQVADFNSRRYRDDTTGFPADPMIWEAVVAVPTFRDGTLVDLALHPISLGFGQPPSQRGRPKFADQELGDKILDDLIRLSAPFGTTIEKRDGVGHVAIRPAGGSD
jgi:poly-gamma-glutamate synthesis protein (capsule biosynthesis protein)